MGLPITWANSSDAQPWRSATVWDADAAQLLLGDRADAGDDSDLHRSQELKLTAGLDDGAAVRLGQFAGHLGNKLRRADAHRGGQAIRGRANLILELRDQ